MYIKSQSKYASSTVQPRLNERASMLPRPSLCSRIRLPCSILFQSQFLGMRIPLCHRTRRCPLACQPPEGSLCMEVSLRPCIPRESPCLPMNSLSTEALAPLGNQRGGGGTQPRESRYAKSLPCALTTEYIIYGSPLPYLVHTKREGCPVCRAAFHGS